MSYSALVSRASARRRGRCTTTRRRLVLLPKQSLSTPSTPLPNNRVEPKPPTCTQYNFKTFKMDSLNRPIGIQPAISTTTDVSVLAFRAAANRLCIGSVNAVPTDISVEFYA